MKKLKKQYFSLLWHITVFISSISYSNAAYAIVPEIIDRIVSDINIWVFLVAGILSLIALIFKSTRTKIFALLGSTFALYLLYTIIKLTLSTHFYE